MSTKEARKSYLNPKVCMEQRLKLKWFIAVVGDDNVCFEAVTVQCNTVQEAEAIRPRFFVFVTEGFGRQAKVELHIGAIALASGLAQKLPTRVAGKAVLWKAFGSFAVASGTKYLPNN